MSGVLETGVEVQEVAEPAETQTGEEVQEVTEPAKDGETEITESDIEGEPGKTKQDAAFAELRRAREEAEERAREAEEELERSRMYRGLLGQISQSDVPEVDIVAQALGISPEELEEQIGSEQQLIELERQNETLERELEETKLAQAMKEDLIAIQKVDPTVKSLNELGEFYFDCIKSGMDGVKAYHAAKFMESQTKSTPAPEPGRVNQSETKKDFFTKEEVEAMSGAEVEKNLEVIEKSMLKW